MPSFAARPGSARQWSGLWGICGYLCNELACRNEPDDEGRPQGAAGYGCMEATLLSDDELITQLSEGIVPVTRIRIWPIVLAQIALVSALLQVVAVVLGMRPDIASGHPLPQFVYRESILGLSAALLYAGAIREARPGAWTPAPLMAGIAVLALLPGLAALSMMVWDREPARVAQAVAEFADVGRCALAGTALAVPGVLLHVWWLHRYGAVTSPRRAAISTGLAAGTAAMFAFGLSCPSAHWLYAGVTYPLVIGMIALSTRLTLTRWLRW